VIPIRLLQSEDHAVLTRLAPDIFDKPIDPRLLEEFLADARHHVAVAIDADLVVGMASAVHYVHPDKRAQMFINEVGVSSAYRRRGLARRLVQALIDEAARLQCSEAWVLADADNQAARALYESAGGTAAPVASIMYTFSIKQAEG
jgi:ribosomal protein S18 acetylase RimI-like enzyme